MCDQKMSAEPASAVEKNRVKVKICGITRLEDALLAIELGVWALGFICYPKSPRYITPEKILAIVKALPQDHSLRLVGVFVNETPSHIRELMAAAGLDTVQLHGDEPSSDCSDLKGFKIWKAFRLQSQQEFLAAKSFESHVEALLYDAAVPGQYGGTGHRVDWDLLDQAPRRIPLLLSGGLNSENALTAWRRFKPLALDLSSGVESSPGVKDAEKLKKLFALLDRG